MPAATSRTDMLVPEILADVVRTGFAGVIAINGTGAGAVFPGLPGNLRGGDTVKVPRLSNLGDFEDVAEGVALTPVGLSMTDDEASVIRTGKAFSVSEWARLAAAYADPYAEAGRQIVMGSQRRIDKALLDAARKAGADLTANTLDVSALQGGAAKLSYDVVVDGRALWGDESEDVVLVGCHSATYASLHKLKDSSGRPLLVDPLNGQLPTFAGIPVKVSDRFTPTGDVHETLIFKRNAVSCWLNNTPSIKEDEDILKDEHIMAINVYLAAVRHAKVDGGTKCGVVRIKHKV